MPTAAQDFGWHLDPELDWSNFKLHCQSVQKRNKLAMLGRFNSRLPMLASNHIQTPPLTLCGPVLIRPEMHMVFRAEGPSVNRTMEKLAVVQDLFPS